MDDKNELRCLQLRLLEMLTEIDRVCKQQKLSYYLLAGTMLGAIRHQGFIPWDDDLDIGLPRPDYERFFQIAKEHLPAYLELKNYTSHPNYSWWFMKVEDNRTTLIEKKHFLYKGGIYIDVFPLDGEAEGRICRKMNFARIEYLKKIRYFLYRDPFKHGHGISSWPSRLLRNMYSREKVQQNLQTQLSKYDYYQSEWVCDHDGGNVSLMPRDFIGKPTPVIFEGREFMGVEQPDAYLKCLYGDYMTLPPENKRFQHHFYYMDLNKPYRENPIDQVVWQSGKNVK